MIPEASARFTSLFCIVTIFVFAAGGCSIQVRMGQAPKIEPLENTLRVGESTSADVILALGQPFGKGRVMFPIDPGPRTMWTYYYAEGDMNDARGLYLFVFFDQDKYDGYMWFSSLKSQTSDAAPKDKVM